MKKAANITGALSAFLVVLSVLLKVNHWPGGSILLIFGIMLFQPFLLLFLVHEFEQNKKGLFIATMSVLGLVLSVLSVGLLFKIQHWPAAGTMVMAGTGMLVVLLLPLLLISAFVHRKDPSWNFNYVVVAMVFGSLLAGMASISGNNTTTLHAHVMQEESARQALERLSATNESMYPVLSDSGTVADHQLLQSRTQEMVGYVEELQHHLIAACDGFDPEHPPHDSAFVLRHVLAKYERTTPIMILIGSDPYAPRNDQYSATDLKGRLEQHLRFLTMWAGNQGLDAFAAPNLTDDVRGPDGVNRSWEVRQFDGQSLVQVVGHLTGIQVQLRSLENELLALSLQQQAQSIRYD